ncbi:MAG: sodium:dicarboxylate symporter [Bacteroidetes bacterium HGW-Bacteroidetes-1]|jgi:sodium-dependent dicarboxylate transporter 2/3/5|nr:MAG: sodium:dicarboxylate symporter [Bacteroidetes bacterium HGW-Bacteroidetes-1]
MTKTKRIISFLLTPLLIIYVLIFVKLDPGNPSVTYTFCVALLMAVWWITEAVPLAVTSLIPVALFPLFGIMDGKEVSSAYFNDVIFLFMGGFLVALAMQRWGLHKRIALHILHFIGTGPARILLGFMFASFFLSMWISNTATAMMMLPIALSVIHQLEELVSKKNISRYSIGLLLGIAYGASIGGVATLVGTPPNLSFSRIFHIYFPAAPEIAFTNWLVFALPFSILFFVVAWLYLYFSFKPNKDEWVKPEKNTFGNQLKSLGKTTQEERVVFVVFVLLSFLWLFRTDLEIGFFKIPGWSNIFSNSKYINDGTVAIMMALVLFLVPSSRNKHTTLLDWNTAAKLPWHILLLFGGGFALASGFKVSGLSLWFGGQLEWVSEYNIFIVILFISLIMTFLTELTSNTATTEILLPVLAGIAIHTEINPLLLMIPATLSASMAFMLPVATPPNAIIFGTSRITIGQMARTGLALNLIGALIISLMMYFWGSYVFDINLAEFPEWAFIK